MEPLVSVIMPAYNKASTIVQSFQSVLDQSHSNWELIVVDDASTDRTKDILSTLIEPRMQRVFLTKNGGVVKAYQEGIRRAKGEYIMFQDSDDMSLPDRIEKCLAVIGNNDVVYHGMYIFARHAEIPIIARQYKPAQAWDKERIYREQYIPGVIFARAGLLKKVKFPEEASGAWDWMHHILLHQMGAKYLAFNVGLYDYIRTPSSSLSYHNEETGKRQASVKWIMKYLKKNKLIKPGHKFGRGFMGLETITKK